MSILWKITIYLFCLAYERRFEKIAISRKIDIIWKLYA